MADKLFSNKLVKVSLNAKTKEEVIDELSELFLLEGKITDKQMYVKDVYAREAEVSTDLEMGVAMPHARSKAVVEAAVAIGISKEGIAFGENGKSNIFVMIAMPSEATKAHIEVLSKVTSVLLEEDNIKAIKNATTSEEVIKIFEVQNEGETLMDNKKVFLIGATGCASGVAHTYLAAKALEKAASKAGVGIRVETNGSIGVENSPTSQEIKDAECIILASDKAVEMTRFEGKKIIYAKVKDGINKADLLIKRAIDGEGEVYHSNASSTQATSSGEKGGIVYRALMNGVSYMLPFVVIGGLMIALSFAFGGTPKDGTLVLKAGSIWQKISDIGAVGFTLMVPILGGYIAFAIGDRAALAPGMVGGWIAANGAFYGAESGTGFLGAIAAGFIAGYVTLAIKKINFPESIRALVPIVIVPIIGTLVVGFTFIFIIGAPISEIMKSLTSMLQSLSGGSLIVLGIVMGLMQGFDFGGPVGKTLFLFSIAMMEQGQFQFIGAQAMAIPVAPLGMAIATFVDSKGKFFDKEDKAAGKAAIVMGFCGISEGAIPFAAADPIAILPASMLGSAVAATMALFMGITNQIAWGGPLVVVLGLTNNAIGALICMLAGSVVTAIIAIGIKTIKNKKTI